MRYSNLVTLLIFALLATVSYAHKGRTDASGGHRDVKNVSGLGGYHYHCDGYSPHLHEEDGRCPYSYEQDDTDESELLEIYKISEAINSQSNTTVTTTKSISKSDEILQNMRPIHTVVCILSVFIALIVAIVNGYGEKSVALGVSVFFLMGTVILCALQAAVLLTYLLFAKAFVEKDPTSIYLHIIFTILMISITLLSKGSDQKSRRIKTCVIGVIILVNAIMLIIHY